MRKIVLLAAGMTSVVPDMMDVDYIGVDHGAVCIMKQGLPMCAAIGDFDSVSKEEYEALCAYTKVEKLPTHKNETDSEVAINYALQQGYEQIILYGGLGGRIDHEMANIHLMIQRDLPLKLMDETNEIQVLKPGTYEIEKHHKYLSFLPLEDTCISESGVAYPLDHCPLKKEDIFPMSNEILNTKAQITIHSGKVLMMQSDD